ncbi:hypothetical protein GGF32_010044 [Allomyces javanicus]|nr:hypothetical protein GGF32_010044 [Allomyces javanicus]
MPAMMRAPSARWALVAAAGLASLAGNPYVLVAHAADPAPAANSPAAEEPTTPPKTSDPPPTSTSSTTTTKPPPTSTTTSKPPPTSTTTSSRDKTTTSSNQATTDPNSTTAPNSSATKGTTTTTSFSAFTTMVKTTIVVDGKTVATLIPTNVNNQQDADSVKAANAGFFQSTTFYVILGCVGAAIVLISAAVCMIRSKTKNRRSSRVFRPTAGNLGNHQFQPGLGSAAHLTGGTLTPAPAPFNPAKADTNPNDPNYGSGVLTLVEVGTSNPRPATPPPPQMAMHNSGARPLAGQQQQQGGGMGMGPGGYMSPPQAPMNLPLPNQPQSGYGTPQQQPMQSFGNLPPPGASPSPYQGPRYNTDPAGFPTSSSYDPYGSARPQPPPQPMDNPTITVPPPGSGNGYRGGPGAPSIGSSSHDMYYLPTGTLAVQNRQPEYAPQQPSTHLTGNSATSLVPGRPASPGHNAPGTTRRIALPSQQ